MGTAGTPDTAWQIHAKLADSIQVHAHRQGNCRVQMFSDKVPSRAYCGAALMKKGGGADWLQLQLMHRRCNTPNRQVRNTLS